MRQDQLQTINKTCISSHHKGNFGPGPASTEGDGLLSKVFLSTTEGSNYAVRQVFFRRDLFAQMSDS